MRQEQHLHPTPRPPHKGLAALALSCVSAAAAETATYPIDAIKTQLQLQHGAVTSSRRAPGGVQLARQLLHTHGVAGLYAGLSPAVLRHFFYTGTRITLYEQLKAAYAARQQHAAAAGSSEYGTASAAVPASAAAPPVWAGLLFGLTAGAVGQLVAVPADLVKVQMQADVRAVMCGQRQQRQFSSMRSVAAALTQQRGVSGLWRGGLPAVQRAALVNLGELSTYDSAKHAISQADLLPNGLPTHLAASLCSGLVSALISTPADVIKTRLMAQAATGDAPAHRHAAGASAAPPAAPGGLKPPSAQSFSSSGSGSSSSGSSSSNSRAAGSCRGFCQQVSASAAPHYKGMVDCAVQTVRQEGLLALYKGFWPTWARLGPWQLVFWVTYEQLRSVAHIGAF